jgi:hypothetical protein
VGIGGLVGSLPPVGFDATGGGEGLGFVATGGGGFVASELEGRELAGVLSSDPLADAAFFQGAAEPFEGARPGKTATGLADASADTDLTEMAGMIGFGVRAEVETAEATAGAGGGGGRGGGGRAAGTDLVFGGTISR